MNMRELYDKADYKDELGMCFRGDCLEVMKDIPDNSVDMILCDLPYGTTKCKWDNIIPFEPLWEQYNRIIKENGAIVLFGNQPFTAELIHSNIKNFKYCWTWDKKIPSGMSYAKYRPMQQTEDICMFTKNGKKTKYFPQMIKRDKPIKGGGMVASDSAFTRSYKPLKKTYKYKNPTTLLVYDKIRRNSLHPTQKPVALLEYLIKTYTNEGEAVLDNCMGSGSTCMACKNTNRRYIGIELDDKYFDIACDRLNKGVKDAHD